MKNNAQLFDELCKALCHIQSQKDMKDFLIDIGTPAELTAWSERWQIAQYINQKIPYRKIAQLTGASTATITRVARCVNGDIKGYKKQL